MKGKFFTSLILSTLCAFGDPLLLNAATSESHQHQVISSETNEQPLLVGQRRGGSRGGSRGGGSRNVSGSRNSGGSRANLQRERGNSNRINRANASNVNRNQARQRTQNIDRNQARQRAQNIDRNQARQNFQNADRNNVENRLRNSNVSRNDVRNRSGNTNINLDRDRNFSNRINRNNIGNNVRVGNNNIVVNPRGGGYRGWGWNGGSAWYSNRSYWGGGFWGPFAAGAVTGLVTGAAINSLSNNNQPTYVIVEQNTPGFRLLSDYGLTQTECSGDVVFINGPEDSTICAIPNSIVPAGIYFIDTETLTIIQQ